MISKQLTTNHIKYFIIQISFYLISKVKYNCNKNYII